MGETQKEPSLPIEGIFASAWFLLRNSDQDISYFIVEPIYRRIKDLAIDLHKDFSRKVTGDPYFKHILYTAYLCFRHANDYGFSEDSQRNVFIGSAFFHDILELKRNNHESFTEDDLYKQLEKNRINPDEAKKIAAIVNFLTPEKKDPDTLSGQWMEKKRIDFNRIMDKKPSDELSLEMLEMAKQVKIADEAANLRETLEEVKSHKDGPDKVIHDHKPFSSRVAVFEERIGIITQRYPKHPLLPQLKNDLFFLKECLPRS